MRGPYRAGSPQEQRLNQLRADIARLAARLQPGYRRRLGDARWHEHDTLLQAPQPDGGDDSARDLDELERRLLDHRAALTDAIAQAPGLLTQLSALPARLPARWLAERTAPFRNAVVYPCADATAAIPSRRSALAAQLAYFVARHDPRAAVLGGDQVALASRFSAYAAPWSIRVTAKLLSDDVETEITTAVAAMVPPLAITPVGKWTRAGKALRGRTDTLTGDAVFDDLFFVEADAKDAEQWLPEAMRARVMRLSAYARPQLHAGDGLATLSVTYPFSRQLLELAMAALAQLRHATAPDDLLLKPAP